MSETTYQLPYTDHVDRLPVTTKCNTCTDAHNKPGKREDGLQKKEIVQTEQEFIVITPYAEGVDPMKLLELAKRLVICKKCGTLRLIN